MSATSAFDAWRARCRAGDPTATLIDLYGLVSRPRGLKPWELPFSERLGLSARALPEMWPGFEFLPDSGRGADPIRLVAYDSSWPRRFEEWRQRLIHALHLPAERIRHVGSIAVPGLLSVGARYRLVARHWPIVATIAPPAARRWSLVATNAQNRRR